MRSIKRLLLALTPAVIAVAASTLAAGLAAPPTDASTTQQFVIEDDAQLHINLAGTLHRMHDLGATIVKVAVRWSTVAPDPSSHRVPSHFSPTDPADYPPANWAFYDAVVRQASAYHMKVGLTLTSPVPLWATGPGLPAGSPYGDIWKPSATAFGAFVKAMGTRYSGHYKPAGQTTPLPRVSWWSIWNEPNYGPDLAPQAIDDNTVYEAADMYRQLLADAWSALTATAHTPRTDTILIGETAPRGVEGVGYPGDFSGTMPVTFLQTLYCVNGAGHELSGSAAAANGCPGRAAALRAEDPALFDASGYAAHLYAQGVPPTIPTYQCGINEFCWSAATKKSTPGYLDFAETPRLEALLKALSGRTFPIWNTEFGYWTTPPDSLSNATERREAVTPSTAALYMNWAEYLSYENPDIASFDQYLLKDAIGSAFSTGLELHDNAKLATYAAYETPLFMPVTATSHPASLTVWGGIRPVATTLSAASLRPHALIQFEPTSGGAFKTLKTVTITNPSGYFDVEVPFTQSGSVRVAWSSGATAVVSRTQRVTIG